MTALQVFNWCHMPDVVTEALQTSNMHLSEGKWALSTLIFRKFSGGYAPRPPYWGGATAPLLRPHPPRRSGACFTPPRLARDLRSLHLYVPPYKNPGYAPVGIHWNTLLSTVHSIYYLLQSLIVC